MKNWPRSPFSSQKASGLARTPTHRRFLASSTNTCTIFLVPVRIAQSVEDCSWTWQIVAHATEEGEIAKANCSTASTLQVQMNVNTMKRHTEGTSTVYASFALVIMPSVLRHRLCIALPESISFRPAHRKQHTIFEWKCQDLHWMCTTNVKFNKLLRKMSGRTCNTTNVNFLHGG